MEIIRCGWSTSDPLYIAYHDQEWGVPLRDDNALFEFLILEGAQAGLSWITVLRKRENYRAAFDNFDPAVVAAYDEAKIAGLLQNPGIIRNRLKINAAVVNARQTLEVQQEFGSFSNYLWNFVDGKPIQNHWRGMGDIPAETEVSRKISKDLSNRGFKFVGSTICYSLMQACGLVNDHTVECFRHDQLAQGN
jgi:DNA-3-methyladenine glycosylase I